MIISYECVELVKEFEGLYLNAYICPAGVTTIGYGHTKNVKIGDKITEKQAKNYLYEDLKEFEKDVSRVYPTCTNQHFFNALVSFAFNCGIGNLQKLIKNRSQVDVLKAMLLYNKANGKVLNGLTRRRKAERELALTFVKNVSRYTTKNDSLMLEVIQKSVGTKVDGIFGINTDNKVKEYQKKHGLKVDGIVGVKTWEVMKNGIDNI